MILYIAGPYRGDVAVNITNAESVAVAVWRAGHVALCPHLNTAFWDQKYDIDDERYLDGDLALLARCDGVVLVPGWESSRGTQAEVVFAAARGIPTWEYPELPPLHPTEVRSPRQCAGFIDIVMQMYRVHLEKNRDYSPANIMGTGYIGLVTRLWDKVARLLNLSGFRITIAEPAVFEAPRNPANESIDDTLLDLANYGVIGQLLRRGNWGR